MVRPAIKKKLQSLLNFLSGRRSIRKKIRKSKLSNRNYKTLRQIEKFEKDIKRSTTTKTPQKFTEDQMLDIAIYPTVKSKLLEKATIQSANMKKLLNERTRIGKFFDRFIDDKEPLNEKNLSTILNRNLGTFKRIRQRMKNRTRKQPYTKPLTLSPVMKAYYTSNALQVPTVKDSNKKTLEPTTLKETIKQAKNYITSIQFESVKKHTRSFQPVNLTFHNNSCFIETTLQMLYRIPEFKTAINDTNIANDILIDTLKNVFSKMEIAEKYKAVKIDIEDLLYCDFECLQPGVKKGIERNQQDITEFFDFCILDKLNRSETQNIFNMFNFKLMNVVYAFYDKKYTILNKTSNIEFVSAYKNSKPNEQSILYHVRNDPTAIIKQRTLSSEPYNIFSIEFKYVNKNATLELQNLIDHNQSVEIITDKIRTLRPPESFPQTHETPLINPTTIKKVIKIKIPKTLKYLCIGLKRWFNEMEKDNSGKNIMVYDAARKNYVVPPATISKRQNPVCLNKYIKVDNQIFEIQGICGHSGSLTSGHYIYYWHSPEDKWWELDDLKPEARLFTTKQSSFVEFNELHNIDQRAFLLIFKRSDMTESDFQQYRTTVSFEGISLLPVDNSI